VPRPLVLTGDSLTGNPLVVLAAENRRHGVSAETFRCKWDGKPPDYGAWDTILEPFRYRRGSPP